MRIKIHPDLPLQREDENLPPLKSSLVSSFEKVPLPVSPFYKGGEGDLEIHPGLPLQRKENQKVCEGDFQERYRNF